MWIVLETFGGAEHATIVTDEEGKNKVFNDHEDAISEALDLQEGYVVEII